MTALRVGTRGSPLAVWQAERIRSLLGARNLESELVRVETAGDLDRETPLARFGAPALFSRELDEALHNGRIDLAVHSLKDLPTTLPAGIRIAAVSLREDPHDALVGREPLTWDSIPPGATIATSSLRRQAQLRRLRPDLQVVELRGNVGTRVDKLDGTTGWDGILLATAGLVRLGLGGRIGERLPLELMLPAPGQGALAVTTRADDHDLSRVIRQAVNAVNVELAVTAERALLHTLEGGCHVPVAAYATITSLSPRTIRLHARVLTLDGRDSVEAIRSGEATSAAHATLLGALLAQELLARGAGRILAEARRQSLERVA